MAESQAQVVYVQAKNPGLAALLSFFYTGLGQIYNGQIGKGIIFAVVQAVNIAMMFIRKRLRRPWGWNISPNTGRPCIIDQGPPVKKNKVIGGEPGRGEIISTKPVLKDRIEKTIKLDDRTQ
jgi:hypothetical protein